MKFYFILFVSLTFCSFELFSQREMFPYDPTPAEITDYPFIDSTMFRVHYRMLAMNDVSKPDDKTENIMLLQIGRSVSKFFNYHRFLADSLSNALALKNTPRSVVNNKVVPLMARTTPLNIFKNYPKGKITTIDRVPFNSYTYEENMEPPKWKLENGSQIVCGYNCKKATTYLFGRNYTAWYAPEISISDGPWKLFGLPGLILKAEDDKGHYSFECITIEKPNWKDVIYNISYKPFIVKKEQFFNLQKRYYENPAATVENSGLIQSPLPSSANKSRPYNPIELSE